MRNFQEHLLPLQNTSGETASFFTISRELDIRRHFWKNENELDDDIILVAGKKFAEQRHLSIFISSHQRWSVKSKRQKISQNSQEKKCV